MAQHLSSDHIQQDIQKSFIGDPERVAPRQRPSIERFYAAAFNLRERPFSLQPDADFIYWSPEHQAAFTLMEYGILSRAPITLITGEIGTGKTTLLHHLLRMIQADHTVALVNNARGGRGDLIRWILHGFGIQHDPALDHVGRFRCLRNFLLDERAAGRPVVIMIDEAQNLSRDALEELRMLTNLSAGKTGLLQLMLIGQPELREVVDQPGMQSFLQRVSASYHLDGLRPEDTRAYIAHRMRHAGGTGDEFTDAAAAAIHLAARGTPRTINKICDMALIYAASDLRKRVNSQGVAEVLAGDLLILPHTPSLH